MTGCGAPGCERDHFGKGWCKWHYDRFTKGDLAALEGPRPPAPTCIDCGKRLRSLNQHRCIPCQGIREERVPNPMVCVCPNSDADPRVNFGECSSCHRKPLRLFRILNKVPA